MEHAVQSSRISAGVIGYSLGLALLWFVLAAVRPGTTFHLAPLLVAIAGPVVYRLQGGASRLTAIRLVAGGLATTAVASVLLALAGLLEGPSLLPFGGAFVEALVGMTAGSLAALVVAVRRNPASSY